MKYYDLGCVVNYILPPQDPLLFEAWLKRKGQLMTDNAKTVQDFEKIIEDAKKGIERLTEKKEEPTKIQFSNVGIYLIYTPGSGWEIVYPNDKCNYGGKNKGWTISKHSLVDNLKNALKKIEEVAGD